MYVEGQWHGTIFPVPQDELGRKIEQKRKKYISKNKKWEVEVGVWTVVNGKVQRWVYRKSPIPNSPFYAQGTYVLGLSVFDPQDLIIHYSLLGAFVFYTVQVCSGIDKMYKQGILIHFYRDVCVQWNRYCKRNTCE